jgi:hypothetical protein
MMAKLSALRTGLTLFLRNIIIFLFLVLVSGAKAASYPMTTKDSFSVAKADEA